MKYTHIIWDFNGTIIDDLQACLDVLNIMLKKRDLGCCSVDRYKEVFDFPIKNYYISMGFDFSKEDYATMADEWSFLYTSAAKPCTLCKGIKEALEFFKNQNIPQLILSATEQNLLLKQMEDLEIKDYFTEALALKDYYAYSKVELGKAWMKRVKPANALFIGDTLHDSVTASAMGIDCVLLATGHQSKSRLEKAGVRVFDTVEELIQILKNQTD